MPKAMKALRWWLYGFFSLWAKKNEDFFYYLLAQGFSLEVTAGC